MIDYSTFTITLPEIIVYTLTFLIDYVRYVICMYFPGKYQPVDTIVCAVLWMRLEDIFYLDIDILQ
jgi:hypothetical protein